MVDFESPAQPAYHDWNSDMDIASTVDIGVAMRPILHNRNESQSRLLQPPMITASGGMTSVASMLKPGGIAVPPQGPVPWRRRPQRRFWSISTHCTACVLVLGLVVLSIMAPFLLASRSVQYGVSLYEPTCDDGGNFRFPQFSNRAFFWLPSGAFQITMGFGAMSFSNAKIIDVVWDIVVGRGGQAILAFISHRVFTKCLTRLMERSSVTLAVFESLTLRDAISVSSIFMLMKDFFMKGTARAKLSMIWIIIASVYALCFQTLMSAMTGYSATSSPYVQIPDGSQIPWSNFRPVTCIIHDAWRIGLTGNYICSDRYTTGGGEYCSDIAWEGLADDQIPKECLIIAHVLAYTNAFGFYGLNKQAKSSFPDPKNYSSDIHLEPPILNITPFYSDAWSEGSDAYALSDPGDNRTYDLAYITQHGVCSPEKKYQWGFSGLLLFFAIVLTTIWAIGMWAMWLDAYYQSNLDLYGRQLGVFRAALDLANVLQENLGAYDDIDGFSDQAIRRRTKSVQFNDSISYANITTRKTTSNRSAELGKWLNRRRWGRWIMRHKIWTTVIAVGTPVSIIVLAIVIPFVDY